MFHISPHKELSKQLNFKSFFASLFSPGENSGVTVLSNLIQLTKIQKDLAKIMDLQFDLGFPRDISRLDSFFNQASNMLSVYIFPFAEQEFEAWPQYLTETFAGELSLTAIRQQTLALFDSSLSRGCLIEDKNNRIHFHPNLVASSVNGFVSYQEILYVSQMEVCGLYDYEVEVFEFGASRAYNPSKMKAILRIVEAKVKKHMEEKAGIQVFFDSQNGQLTEYSVGYLSRVLELKICCFSSFSSFFPFDTTIGLFNFLSSNTNGIYFRIDWIDGRLLTVTGPGVT